MYFLMELIWISVEWVRKPGGGVRKPILGSRPHEPGARAGTF